MSVRVHAFTYEAVDNQLNSVDEKSQRENVMVTGSVNNSSDHPPATFSTLPIHTENPKPTQARLDE